MVPSLFHFMSTPKLGMKQGLRGQTKAPVSVMNWYPVSLNATQFVSLYGYTQIGNETGVMGGQTRAQRQGDFKDNSYIKCLAILSLTQIHEMMPILRVSMKLISRPLGFAMMFLRIIVSTHFMMSLVINFEWMNFCILQKRSDCCWVPVGGICH